MDLSILDPLSESSLTVSCDPPSLPELSSLFSIPKLEEKPQNPIIQSIEHSHLSRVRRSRKLQDRGEQHEHTTQECSHTEDKNAVDDTVWVEKSTIAGYHEFKRIISWDTFSSPCPTSLKPLLLSEQSPDIIAAARRGASRSDFKAGDRTLNLSRDELYSSLELTLAGCTSPLHEWDEERRMFRLTKIVDEIVVDDLDETVTNSYLETFLEIGFRYRRLEDLISQNGSRSGGWNSTTLAFYHAVRSVLIWSREETNRKISDRGQGLCNLAIAINEVNIVLGALFSLCFDAPEFLKANSPAILLSHLYKTLLDQTERGSPYFVRRIFSYILTVASRPYFQSLAKSIGLVGLEETLSVARRKHAAGQENAIGDIYEIDFEDEGDGDENGAETDEFPCFMDKETKEAVVRARRSIRILASPELEEGISIELPIFRHLEWVWTDREITMRALGNQEHVEESNLPVHESPREENRKYKTELKRFALFDLEPASLAPSPISDLRSFIESFPNTFPSLSPTLPILALYVLSPIRAQALALGHSALCLFLTPSTPLHLRAHLILLRSTLLLGSPAFKARLAGALFSDAEPDDDPLLGDLGAFENPMGVTIRTRARNANYREVQSRTTGEPSHKKDKKERRWAVGLGFGLTDRDQWPPGGSDLGFYLRRVIMDSIEHIRIIENVHNEGELGDNEFWDDAESRLGFAIRDLPSGTGKEKWLDPTSIEALDFLYMEYRPPRPLRSLITTDIMSKYQRVFAFLLRLLRVEYAMRLVFRVTRPTARMLFERYHRSRVISLQLRFEGQAFLSALSAYVADTVIGGNFDAFIDRLRAAESVAASPKGADSEKIQYMFADVYSLMRHHGKVLDAILAGCLLRGTQRVAGEILWAMLEILLEFCVLVGNVHRGVGAEEEARAATRVEALYAKYAKTRGALLKVLQKMTRRGWKKFGMDGVRRGRTTDGIRSGTGGMEALSDLMLRLDAVGPSLSMEYDTG